MIDPKIFVDAGILSEENSRKILSNNANTIGFNFFNALLESDLSEDQILGVLSKEYNIPFKTKVPSEISNNLLAYITEESVKEYLIVPIDFVDNVLEIGILDPTIPGIRDAIRFISQNKNIPYKIFLIPPRIYKAIHSRYGGVGNIADDALEQVTDSKKDEKTKESSLKTEENKPVDISASKDDAPMRRVLSTIIRDAILMRASDIHIENEGKVLRVRYRVDGELSTKTTIPAEAASSLVAIVKLNSKLLLDEHRKPQDGSFSVVHQNRKIDLRVSTLPAYYGEKVVIRILDTAAGVFKISELGMRDEHLELVKSALNRPYGLILITGPTGSGKSTTLYAMLAELDKETKNIVSLEDPVEYQVAGITQSQVHSAIGYTFASGLRSILRQDPDVIMVGEIRDKETAQLAIQAALTGHLVLATLHTNSAVGAIPRLIDMGIDPYLIAPTLILSIAQRLTKKFADGAQTKKVPIDDAAIKMFQGQIADLPEEVKAKIQKPEFLYEPVSSNEHPTGLSGRMSVLEMFNIDKDVEHQILSNPKEDELYKLARAKGMLVMREDAYIKAFNGKIPINEVYSL